MLLGGSYGVLCWILEKRRTVPSAKALLFPMSQQAGAKIPVTLMAGFV